MYKKARQLQNGRHVTFSIRAAASGLDFIL